MPTMLPSVPKSLGRLSDVFRSAMAAASGSRNTLNLKSVDSAVVILVDGLGSANLRSASGHARFLSAALSASPSISTVFPTTTAAALTSLATGVLPAEHGIVGYRVFDRDRNQAQNLLSGWTSFEESHGWRVGDTLSESAEASGLAVHFVGLGAYERSGFTNIIMPDAEYHAADSVADRFNTAARLVRDKGHIVYLYVPELDQLAHAKGTDAFEWLAQLEELDALVRDFAGRVGNRVGVLLTADHGVVDVPKSSHIELGSFDLAGLSFAGGDTRCAFLYFESTSKIESSQQLLNEEIGDSCWVVTPAELIEAGWMPKPNQIASARLPDLYVLAKKQVAIYHKAFSSYRSYAMVGHHGSITPEELSVPLLRLAAWS
jgi:Type I phosphodiesterase / nucleotide pyrophosphatase